jgi:hypothetical protein
MALKTVEPNDLVLAKLIDGTFIVGKYIEYGEEKLRFIQDAYLLMLQQLGNGEVRVGIADFYSPFIQDGAGTILSERDWIGTPQPMPATLIGDYTQKKTGIRIAPAGSIIQP